MRNLVVLVFVFYSVACAHAHDVASSSVLNPNIECGYQGGQCIAKGATCKGRRVECSCLFGLLCGDCCIPECPYDEGFFSPPGSRQCFKYVEEEEMNWDAAKDKCQTEKPGLVLAHPFDPATLQSYMIQRFDQSYVWLNARGNGDNMAWQDTSGPIPSYSRQWVHHTDVGFGPEDCLALADWYHDWNYEPPTPFVSKLCTDNAKVLCELVIDAETDNIANIEIQSTATIHNEG